MVIVLSERSSVQVACIIYTFSSVLALKLGQVCVSNNLMSGAEISLCP